MVPLTISAQKGLINQYDYFDKQIASLNLSNYYIIQNGEFAYNKSYSNGYPYGAIKRLDYFEQGALSSLYICFSISNINSDYLVKYFDSGKWNKQVKLISGEGARNHGLLNLSPDDFFNINIMISPFEGEQTKIAHFLNLINSKIKYIDKKIEALKKYRKGIINSWFKNNGKTLRLCELVTQQTSQLLTHQIKDNIGTYPVYDATGNIYKSIDFYMNENDSIAIIKYGSGCGRTFITHDKHCVLGTMSELIPLNHRDLTYIFAFTESSKFKKICKKYIEVGTTPNLYYSDYSTELVYYPDERNNFVELIDLISKKRVYLETEKEKLNQLKRQLLKDMFI